MQPPRSQGKTSLIPFDGESISVFAREARCVFSQCFGHRSGYAVDDFFRMTNQADRSTEPKQVFA